LLHKGYTEETTHCPNCWKVWNTAVKDEVKWIGFSRLNLSPKGQRILNQHRDRKEREKGDGKFKDSSRRLTDQEAIESLKRIFAHNPPMLRVVRAVTTRNWYLQCKSFTSLFNLRLRPSDNITFGCSVRYWHPDGRGE